MRGRTGSFTRSFFMYPVRYRSLSVFLRNLSSTSYTEALMKAQEARFASQLRKMNELRKKELRDREEAKKDSESDSGASGESE